MRKRPDTDRIAEIEAEVRQLWTFTAAAAALLSAVPGMSAVDPSRVIADLEEFRTPETDPEEFHRTIHNVLLRATEVAQEIASEDMPVLSSRGVDEYRTAIDGRYLNERVSTLIERLHSSAALSLATAAFAIGIPGADRSNHPKCLDLASSLGEATGLAEVPLAEDIARFLALLCRSARDKIT